MLHLLDVSAFQPVTIPEQVDGVFVKATEGSRYVSGVYGPQMASARRMSQFQGAYHFARPEESSAESQADRFTRVAKPTKDMILWLDLEASKLSQLLTNLWARAFATRLRLTFPHNRIGVYMGAGYASSGTGEGLADFFDLWWYAQYPSVYQLNLEGEEFWRLMNRSHYTPDRAPIATSSSIWPNSYSPWLPSGLTCGWKTPHFWQFTDNHKKYDASVSNLTLPQIWGQTEEDAWQWFLATSG
jgi:hypothetical protein